MNSQINSYRPIAEQIWVDEPVTVSIVVATYNHSRFILQAIEGFLMQRTNFRVEILVNDDASTDTTAVIVKGYEEKHPQLFRNFYQKENQYSKGIKPWFQVLFPAAKGKYIALCEGDDYWIDPSKLQKQIDLLEKNGDYSACFHDAIVLKEGQEQRKYANKTKEVFTTVDLFDRHFIPTASIVFRNQLELPSWLKNVSSGDIALLLLLSLQGNLYFINEAMSVYRQHPEGVSNTHTGMTKVFGIAKLMTYFDAHTNVKYADYCKKSLLYEFHTHISRIQEIDYSKLSNFNSRSLFRELMHRFVLKVKRLFG